MLMLMHMLMLMPMPVITLISLVKGEAPLPLLGAGLTVLFDVDVVVGLEGVHCVVGEFDAG